MPPNPNKNNVVDALESLNINELVETIETVPDKEPTKDEGNIFYSYVSSHMAVVMRLFRVHSWAGITGISFMRAPD